MPTLIYNAPMPVTESQYGIALGYYVTCDDAVCRDCAPAGFAHGDYSEWPGFEGWEEPIAILMDDESDTPTHCGECGAVIAHDLTTDGAQYVMDAIAEFIAGEGHNPDVMAQWWDAYSDVLDENDLAMIAGTIASPDGDADEADLRELIEQAMADQGVRTLETES